MVKYLKHFSDEIGIRNFVNCDSFDNLKCYNLED